MVERTDKGITRTSGMNTWRAGCGESRTSGSEGGPGRPTSREADRAPWSDPYVYRPLETAQVLGARERGCRVLDGGAMALHQAADTYALVTDVEPDRERMAAHFARLVAPPA